MNLTEEVSIDQIVDWLRFQEEKGLTLKDCINKLEKMELFPESAGIPDPLYNRCH